MEVFTFRGISSGVLLIVPGIFCIKLSERFAHRCRRFGPGAGVHPDVGIGVTCHFFRLKEKFFVDEFGHGEDGLGAPDLDQGIRHFALQHESGIEHGIRTDHGGNIIAGGLVEVGVDSGPHDGGSRCFLTGDVLDDVVHHADGGGDGVRILLRSGVERQGEGGDGEGTEQRDGGAAGLANGW